MKQTKRRQAGFSLIEILVVLVIIGLLAGIVAPNLIGEVGRAEKKRVETDFRSIETALKIYRLDNFTYPTSEQGLAALVEQPTLDPVPRNWRRYLDEEPLDPWGRPYLYLSPGENGEFDIYTLGADGVSGGDGANEDIGNWKTDQDS